MKVRVQRWGNSLALRIPKPFAEDVNVRQGTLVDLSLSDGRLIAVPVRRKKPSLKSLLARVTDANRHAAVDFGQPVGRESW